MDRAGRRVEIALVVHQAGTTGAARDQEQIMAAQSD